MLHAVFGSVGMLNNNCYLGVFSALLANFYLNVMDTASTNIVFGKSKK